MSLNILHTPTNVEVIEIPEPELIDPHEPHEPPEKPPLVSGECDMWVYLGVALACVFMLPGNVWKSVKRNTSKGVERGIGN